MKGKELKTIHVSEEIWRRLVELKLELKLRSLDDVIRFLLQRVGLRSPEEIRRRVLLWEDAMERAYAAPCREEEGAVGYLLEDPECIAAIIRELRWVLGEEGG